MKTKTAEQILIERFGIDPNKSGHDEINTNCVNVIEAMEEYANQFRTSELWAIYDRRDGLIYMADFPSKESAEKTLKTEQAQFGNGDFYVSIQKEGD